MLKVLLLLLLGAAPRSGSGGLWTVVLPLQQELHGRGHPTVCQMRRLEGCAWPGWGLHQQCCCLWCQNGAAMRVVLVRQWALRLLLLLLHSSLCGSCGQARGRRSGAVVG